MRLCFLKTERKNNEEKLAGLQRIMGHHQMYEHNGSLVKERRARKGQK